MFSIGNLDGPKMVPLKDPVMSHTCSLLNPNERELRALVLSLSQRIAQDGTDWNELTSHLDGDESKSFLDLHFRVLRWSLEVMNRSFQVEAAGNEVRKTVAAVAAAAGESSGRGSRVNSRASSFSLTVGSSAMSATISPGTITNMLSANNSLTSSNLTCDLLEIARSLLSLVEDVHQRKLNYYGIFDCGVIFNEVRTLVSYGEQLLSHAGIGATALTDLTICSLKRARDAISRSRSRSGSCDMSIVVMANSAVEAVEAAETEHECNTSYESENSTGLSDLIPISVVRQLKFQPPMDTYDKNHRTTSSGELHSSLLLRIFWAKYFGSSATAEWSRWIDVFELEYGPQTDDTKEKLRNNLNIEVDTPANENSPVPDHLRPFLSSSQRFSYSPSTNNTTLRFADVARLLGNDNSLYYAYQRECDPGNMLVLSGLLYDNIVDCPVPTVIKPLLGVAIHSVCCGDQHIAVVTKSGLLYTWGRGAFGRLGHGTDLDQSTPKLVQFFESRKIRIVQVSCGFAFTGAVTDTGEVYTWGAGMNGRLGLGDTNSVYFPTRIPNLEHEFCLSMHAGSVHACVLTKTGRVYSFGKADYVGHSTKENVTTPRLLDIFNDSHVVQVSIASGGFHTLALTADGRLFSWGHNRVGQLGIDMNEHMLRGEDGGVYFPTPHEVKGIPNNITKISAGWGHSGIITSNGQVYMCGRNVEGQLGVVTEILETNERGHKYRPAFTEADRGDLALRRLRNVICAGEHTIFLTVDDDIIASGLSDRGQLGTGCTERMHSIPFRIPFFSQEKRKVLDISCGFNCTAVLLSHREPGTLRHICANAIRAIPELWNFFNSKLPMIRSEVENGSSEPRMATEDDQYIDEHQSTVERELQYREFISDLLY